MVKKIKIKWKLKTLQKKLLRCLAYLCLGLVGLLIGLYFLLQLPFVQNEVGQFVIKQLSALTSNKLSIRKVLFRPFNQIELQHIYLEDLAGDTLFCADKLSADFSIWGLLNNQLTIHTINLSQFEAHIKKDSLNGSFNFGFLLGEPSTDTTSTKSAFQISILDLSLQNGQISYDLLSAPDTVPPQQLDFNHIKLSDVQLQANLSSLDPENLAITLQQLSFKEQSGLQVLHLAADCSSSKNQYQLHQLVLDLPHSHLYFPDVQFNIADLNQLGLEIKLSESYLTPSDLQTIVPMLASFTDSIQLATEISGRLPQISIKHLHANYIDAIVLDANAELADLFQYENSDIQLTIDRLQINQALLPLLQKLDIVQPSLRKMAFPYTLKAHATGRLSDLLVETQVQSADLQLDVSSHLGIDLKLPNYDFDIEIKKLNTSLGHQLLTADFGKLDLTARITGQANASGLQWGRFQSQLKQLQYHQYAYHAITMDGGYNKVQKGSDSPGWQFQLVSKDTNLLASVDLVSDFKQTDFKVTINDARLQNLQLTPSLDSSCLTSAFNGSIEGTSLDQLLFQIDVDSLQFSNTSNHFTLHQLGLSYKALKDGAKDFNLYSNILNGYVKGHFSSKYLPSAINNVMASYYPNLFVYQAIPKDIVNNLEFKFTSNLIEKVCRTLDLPFIIQAESSINGLFDAQENKLHLALDCPKLNYQKMDFTNFDIDIRSQSQQLNLHAAVNLVRDSNQFQFAFDGLSVKDSLNSVFSFAGQGTREGKTYNMKGKLASEIAVGGRGEAFKDIHVALLPTQIQLNEKVLKIQPATLRIKDDAYTITNFGILLSDTEYFKIDGVVSKDIDDTLNINFAHLQLATLFDLVQLNTGLTGEINGTLLGNGLLSQPKFQSKDLVFSDLVFNTIKMGNLYQAINWDEENKSLAFESILKRGNNVPDSRVGGRFLPNNDSLTVDIQLNELELAWLQMFAGDQVFGLDGKISSELQVFGKFNDLHVLGKASFNKAQFGITATNAVYTCNDVVLFEAGDKGYAGKIVLNNFKLMDQNNKEALFQGFVNYQDASKYTTQIEVSFTDFLLLNNAQQTNNLYYGTILGTGKSRIDGDEKGLNVGLSLENGLKSKVFVILPDDPNAAAQYSSVSFVSENDSLQIGQVISTKAPVTSFPLKLKLDLSINSNLTIGVIIDPKTKDLATVVGAGKLSLDYDLATSKMSILGRYGIESGDCLISLMGIASKKFKVQKGGYLVFKGDPMATEYNITAAYSVRADLVGLDPSFGNDQQLSSTRVMVNSLITAKGVGSKFTLDYDIKADDVSDELQQKMAAIMPTQEIKIKEIAYLFALGAFYSPIPSETSGAGSNLWASVASSTLTNQLNNVMGNVLKDNWTIGTEIYTDDQNASSKVKMDVSISTRLLNNRLTLSSNFGYKNNSAQTSTLSGDFEAQYKLNRAGNWLLRMYNLANEQYYNQTRTVTGVGLIYRREAKKFKNLFKRSKKK